MNEMNVALPETLKNFVDDEVSARGYGNSSEYVCALIRREQDRQRLRTLVLDGAASPQKTVADAEYFDQLRSRVRNSGRT